MNPMDAYVVIAWMVRYYARSPGSSWVEVYPGEPVPDSIKPDKHGMIEVRELYERPRVFGHPGQNVALPPMRRLCTALKVLAGLVLCLTLPIPAQADEAAKLLNLQLADAISTRILLQHPCAYERDPLTRGLVRSDLGALGSAIVTNLLARKWGNRGFFRIASGTEALAIANNVHESLSIRCANSNPIAPAQPDGRRSAL